VLKKWDICCRSRLRLVGGGGQLRAALRLLVDDELFRLARLFPSGGFQARALFWHILSTTMPVRHIVASFFRVRIGENSERKIIASNAFGGALRYLSRGADSGAERRVTATL